MYSVYNLVDGVWTRHGKDASERKLDHRTAANIRRILTRLYGGRYIVARNTGPTFKVA